MNKAAKALPEPGNWTIDATHSFVFFAVEHFRVAIARGIASGPSGRIVIADDVTQSTVTASIDAATIRTGNAIRDERIAGPDLLEVDKYPTIDFASSKVQVIGADHYAIDGPLTLHGVTKPIRLDAVFNGTLLDTFGTVRLGLTASAEIDRDAFGAGEWGHRALEIGGFMVPHAVTVTLDIEATKDEVSS